MVSLLHVREKVSILDTDRKCRYIKHGSENGRFSIYINLKTYEHETFKLYNMFLTYGWTLLEHPVDVNLLVRMCISF